MLSQPVSNSAAADDLSVGQDNASALDKVRKKKKSFMKPLYQAQPGLTGVLGLGPATSASASILLGGLGRQV